MKQRLHPIELTLMIVAALALTSGAVALHTQSQLAEKVVRLHVLANSDSEEDQALKLKVRDAVLEQDHGDPPGSGQSGRGQPPLDGYPPGVGGNGPCRHHGQRL